MRVYCRARVPAPSSQDEGIEFEVDMDYKPPSASLVQEAPPEASGVEQTIADPSGSLELELEPPLPDVSFTQTDSVNQGGLASDSLLPEGRLLTADEVTPVVESDNEEKTQLDLANAYLEMGDPAAAREILTGLSLSQDPAIKERAQALLEEARK